MNEREKLVKARNEAWRKWNEARRKVYEALRKADEADREVYEAWRKVDEYDKRKVDEYDEQHQTKGGGK